MTSTAELAVALEGLRRESSVAPSVRFQAGARAAMHLALARRRDSHVLWIADVLRSRLRLAGGVLAATLVAVVAVGWSAPAGSPLYSVRLAREQVSLLVPGTDRSAAELGNAESRLEDATAGRNVNASLQAAAALLNAAHHDLPADRGDSDWARWQQDQAELGGLEARDAGSSDDVRNPGAQSLGEGATAPLGPSSGEADQERGADRSGDRGGAGDGGAHERTGDRANGGSPGGDGHSPSGGH